jgi:RND family efflux transporter MFP subunit
MRFVVPLVFVSALSAPARADEPPKVDLKKGVEFTGRAAGIVSNVRPRVTGYVERVLVKEGEAVKKGDVLAEMDDRAYKLELDLAKAKLTAARAEAKIAAVDFARTKGAFEKGVASKEEFLKAEAVKDRAEALVVLGKAETELAELKLSFTKLTAPMDGRVSRLAITTGDVLAVDGPVAVSILDAGTITVHFDVDERTLTALSQALGDNGKPAVGISLGDAEGYPHKAKLERPAVTLDPATGTARFRATLANPKGLIVPGQFLRLRLTVEPGK